MGDIYDDALKAEGVETPDAKTKDFDAYDQAFRC